MNKTINWFPGHMAKALREMRNIIKLVDVTFIILDARLPKSSMNPEVLKIAKIKPIIILFNKADLSDRFELKKWIEDYRKDGFICHEVNSKKPIRENDIIDLARLALKSKLEKLEKKNMMLPPMKAMISGVPNVGKSTFINNLTTSKAVRTANTPGITRQLQWIRINENFDLLDTPGVLWPKISSSTNALNLAVTGAIKDSVLPENEVVIYALKFLKKYYPKALLKRYGKESLQEEIIDVLEHIGKLRGARLHGNKIDYDRVYQIILTDVRNDYMGGLCFDRFDEKI